jgi:hypothetical protein
MRGFWWPFSLICMLNGVIKTVRAIAILLLLFLVSGVLAWLSWGKPWFMPASFAAGQLERLLPGLEQTQTEAYRNQGWCKNIAYSYGNFSESSHPTTCNLFEGTPRAFDEQAKRDFQTLRQVLRLTGVRVAFVNIYYEGGTVTNERVRLAEFNLSCFLCSRTRYVYEPNYVLPEDMGSEMWFDAVNKNWYIVNEDWN